MPRYPLPRYPLPNDPYLTWCGVQTSADAPPTCYHSSTDVMPMGLGNYSKTVHPGLSAAALAGDDPDFNMGTGWGAARKDRVDEVNFNRGLELDEFSIYYSDAAGLKAAGIEVDKKAAVSSPVRPKGFGGFCKPPVVTSS